MRFAVKITAFIEAKDEADAQRQAAVINSALANPSLKMMLRAEKVAVVGHNIEPRPSKV